MVHNTGKNITQGVIWGMAIIIFFRLPIVGFMLLGALVTWSFRRHWLKLTLAWLIFLFVLVAGYQLRALLF